MSEVDLSAQSEFSETTINQFYEDSDEPHFTW